SYKALLIKKRDFEGVEDHGVKSEGKYGKEIGQIDIASSTLIVRNGGVLIEDRDKIIHDKEICREGRERGNV
ncbi:MAG: hypothetical protein ABEH43_00215, partial [Flavobacteriales bacterium]